MARTWRRASSIQRHPDQEEISWLLTCILFELPSAPLTYRSIQQLLGQLPVFAKQARLPLGRQSNWDASCIGWLRKGAFPDCGFGADKAVRQLGVPNPELIPAHSRLPTKTEASPCSSAGVDGQFSELPVGSCCLTRPAAPALFILGSLPSVPPSIP